EHLPVTVRHAIGRRARRPVDRTAARARIGRNGGGVERRVLDGVAHRAHGGLAVALDLEERATALQPEEPPAAVRELIAHVHVLVRETDVELESLEDGGDAVASEVEAALHPPGVDRARPHPLLDRDGLARRGSEPEMHVRQRPAIQQVAEEHVLPAERGERGAREARETHGAPRLAEGRPRDQSRNRRGTCTVKRCTGAGAAPGARTPTSQAPPSASQPVGSCATTTPSRVGASNRWSSSRFPASSRMRTSRPEAVPRACGSGIVIDCERRSSVGAWPGRNVGALLAAGDSSASSRAASGGGAADSDGGAVATRGATSRAAGCTGDATAPRRWITTTASTRSATP